MGEVNRRIFELLEEQGKTMRSLAEYIGAKEAAVGAWKKRGTDPKAIFMPKIAEFLGVSRNYIETGENDNNELEDVYLSLAKEAKNNAIDPDDIRMAIKMIKEIRETENKK